MKSPPLAPKNNKLFCPSGRTIRDANRATRVFRAGLPGRVLILLAASVAMAAGCQPEMDPGSSEYIVDVTTDNFQVEVLEATQPVLVEFWAPWCRPCIEMAPAMEQVAQDTEGTAKVARIRIDSDPDLAERYEIAAPPVLLLFDDGEVVKRRYGKQTEDQLMELISSAN